jgi:hypothetical protein
LPGGHAGTAAGTGQSTGTNAGQGTGTNAGQGTGANAGQGTGANAGQGTGANAGQGTGANAGQGTGANAGQGTGTNAGQGTATGPATGHANSPTGTAPTGNDPAGHTGTNTGTSSGSTSGAIGNQPSNSTAGTNTGTTQTGQNQQGSAGSAASPVLPGGHAGTAAGTGQGTGANAGQSTGANAGQGTGANAGQGTGANAGQGTGTSAGQGTGANAGQSTGANAGQGTGANAGQSTGTNAGQGTATGPATGHANSPTGTAPTGNDPAGHTGTTTGTTAGTSSGSTSGAIGNQPSNSTAGTNTGTTQTGQNQQGSAGSAASPVLPGGHAGAAAGTGQGTGANAGQSTGTNAGQGTGANAGQSTGTNAGQGTGANAGQSTGTNAGQGTGANAGQSTGTNAGQGTGTNAGQGTGTNAGQGTGTNAGQGTAAGSVNSPVGAGHANSPTGTAPSGNDPAGHAGTTTGTTSGTSSGSTSGAIGSQPANTTAGSSTPSGTAQSGQNQQGSAGNAAAPVSHGGLTQSGTATGTGASANGGASAGQTSGVNAGQGTGANAGQAAGTNNAQGTVTNAGQTAGNAAPTSGVVGQSGTSAAQPGAASQTGGQAPGSNGAAHSPVVATGTPGNASSTSGNTAGTQAGASASAVNDPSGASTVQLHAPQSSAASSISNTTNAPAGSTTPATSTSNSSAPATSTGVVNAPANQSSNQSSNIPSSGHTSTTNAATTPSGAIGGSQSGAMGGGGSTTSNASVPSGSSTAAPQGQAPTSSATSNTASNAPANNSGAQTTSSSNGEPGAVQDPSMVNNTNATVDPGASNSSVLQDPAATTGSAPALPDPSQIVSTQDPDQSVDPSNSTTTTTASTPAQPAAPDATTVSVVDSTTSVDPQSNVNVGSGIDEVVKVTSNVVADTTPINIDVTAPASALSSDTLTPLSVEQLADGILNAILNEATAPVVAPVVDLAPTVGYSEPVLQSFDPVILDQIITSSTSTPSKSESPVAADDVVIDSGSDAQGPDTGFDAGQDAMDAILLEQRQMAERQRAIDELAALQQQMGYGEAPQVEASTSPDGWGTSSVDSATYFGPLDDYIAASYSDWMDQGTSSYDGVSSFGTPYQDVISNWSTNSSFGQPVNDSGLPAPDAMSAIYDDLNNPDSYSVLPPNSDTVVGAQGDNLITRYADQSNGLSDSKSANSEPTETNIISDKTGAATVASNEGLPAETNELPNWLDQSMANLGASGLIVEPPKAAKQEETIDMAPPATDLPDSERLDTEAVTGLKSDLQSYDEKEARWQEVQELQQRLADAINSFAEATRNQVSDVTAQGVEFGADVRQNTEQVLQDLNQMAEEEARLIRENERERLEVERAQRTDDAKEHSERVTAQQAEHKKHQEERELHLKEEKERKLAQEMATILAVRQQSEAETRARELRLRQEREVLQEMIRKDNVQEKYVVRPNEDLYMIAVRKFKDPRVADLIYELNKTKVEVRWTSGKRSYYVQPGVVVLLPSPRQSREWLARQMTIIGKVPPRLGMSGTTSVGADERRNNIERVLGKIKEASNQNEKTYSVRLGDTLRSVAMKHPDLRDVTLWKLLATKNGLTPDMDSKGSPLAILIRGSILNIPTAEEISAYRAEHSPTKATTKEPYSFPSHAILDLATKPCGGCDRLLSQSATICPACGFAFNERPEASVESQSTTFNIPKGTPTLSLDDDEPRTVVTTQQSDTTIVDMDKTTLSLPEAGRKANTNDGLIRIDSEFEEVDGSRTIEAFSQTCRLVRVEVQARGRRIVRQQLELISGDNWIPVLAYEVGNECSTRHEYSRDGRRKSISIDLPSVAVGQMVQNELSQNWEKYCERFLSGRKLSV